GHGRAPGGRCRWRSPAGPRPGRGWAGVATPCTRRHPSTPPPRRRGPPGRRSIPPPGRRRASSPRASLRPSATPPPRRTASSPPSTSPSGRAARPRPIALKNPSPLYCISSRTSGARPAARLAAMAEPDRTDARPPVPDSEAEAPIPVGPGSRAARMGRTIRGLAVDLSPLRASRDFRILWAASLVSQTGRQFTVTAVFIQVFDLTHSAAAVGLVGLVELVPLIIGSIGAGSIVDAVDRRKLMFATQVCYAGASSLLLLTALLHLPVGYVYLFDGLSAAIGGVASPTTSAMTPRLVGNELLPSALALNQVMWNTTMIVGPALGGIGV